MSAAQSPAHPAQARPQEAHAIAWRPPGLDVLREVSDVLREADPGLGRRPGEEHALDMYVHENRVLREFFLLRLRMVVWLMNRLARDGSLRLGEAVDLGGGSGIMSAIMSPAFRSVRLVDLDCDAARLVFARVPSPNVTLEEGDATARPADGRADAVVAADVLEHFLDLPPIVEAVKGWLAPGGLLITSLPTENLWYNLLRVVFRKTKPHDHYHTSAEVEAVLRAHGFVRVGRVCHPLGLPLFPLFSISAWRKAPGA